MSTQALQKNKPVNACKNRSSDGKFAPGRSGNPKGRPKGSLSITAVIKKKLEEVPEGEKSTYLELLVEQILQRAIIEGDYQMIKQVWNYVDGTPKGFMHMESDINLPIPILSSLTTKN